MEHIYSSNSAQYQFFAESYNQNREAAKRHQDRKKTRNYQGIQYNILI